MRILPRRRQDLRGLALAALALLGPGLRPGVEAAEKRYRLVLAIKYDARRTFEYVELLDARAGRKLELDPVRRIKPYKEKAREALAKKQGYAPEIYGADFAKHVTIDSYTVALVDLRTGRYLVGQDPRRRR